MFNSLSGRFLILTLVFIMLAEVLIFVPSIARFREDYLNARLERAQIASLVLLAEDMINEDLETELLENADVFNVVLRRDEARQLMLSSTLPMPVAGTFDLRDPNALTLIGDALKRIVATEPAVIRVIGDPVREAGLFIEVTLGTQGLRAAMIDYGIRVLILSAVISIFTSVLLFFAVRRLFVSPIRGVVGHMQNYAAAPEDAHRILQPTAKVVELREAEEALHKMQNDLTAALKQKDRLAQLGSAVAKISHDLRNILTSAQLFTDRIEGSQDPTVNRLAPKLVNSITRAVTLCETTLAFGKAEEPAPSLQPLPLEPLVADVVEAESLAAADGVSITHDVSGDFLVTADSDQLFRVISNLVRNARQALSFSGGTITVTAKTDQDAWKISVVDTGPGLPAKAQENLFTAFQGGTRKDGSGLGLAISSELIRGHGGTLELAKTSETGTEFEIMLPKPK